MGQRRLVVVGAEAAGMAAASQARRLQDDDALRISAFERGRWTSYSACGIPYWVGGSVEELDDLVVRSPEQHSSRGIDVHFETEVVSVDLGLATACWAGMTVKELMGLDLACAPPFSPVWDPVLIAARGLGRRRSRLQRTLGPLSRRGGAWLRGSLSGGPAPRGGLGLAPRRRRARCPGRRPRPWSGAPAGWRQTRL